MKILVAVDPSDATRLAVSKAVDFARKEGAELTLLAVAEAMEDMESLFGASATERLREKASKALDSAQALVAAAGLKAKEALKTGVSPEEIIVDFAEAGKFDLIVTGSRGKQGAKKLLLGSVASKVAALAPCSVLVAR